MKRSNLFLLLLFLFSTTLVFSVQDPTKKAVPVKEETKVSKQPIGSDKPKKENKTQKTQTGATAVKETKGLSTPVKPAPVGFATDAK